MMKKVIPIPAIFGVAACSTLWFDTDMALVLAVLAVAAAIDFKGP